MFAANFLNQLSSKYLNNIQRLRAGGRPRVKHQSNKPKKQNDDYLENITLSSLNFEESPLDDFIDQNDVSRERKQIFHDYHPPPPPPPPPQLPHRPLHRYHHHHHTFVDHTIALFSVLLVLGGIFVYLHKLESDVNNNTFTLMSNTSFAPDIDINLNTTSGSTSSADTTSSISINGTYPVFVYENGTIFNVTFFPVYSGFGYGWPFVGGGLGGAVGNIGRSLYDNLDDIIQGFTNIIEDVNKE